MPTKMTDDQINVLIAEKVFCWTRVSGKDVPDQATNPDVRDGHRKGVWVLYNGKRVACDECGDMPNWAGELEAAWRVYLMLLGEKPNALIGYMQIGPLWMVFDPILGHLGYGKTAPRAICLALLKIRGVTEEDDSI